MFSFLGVTIASRIYGVSYAEAIGLIGSPELTPAGVGVQRWVQAFYNLGSFLVSAVVFSGFYRKPILSSLGLTKRPERGYLLYMFILTLMTVIVVSNLAYYNSLLPGLDRLGDLTRLQEQRNKMLEVLLYAGNGFEIALLLFLLALLPAVCEEVFFRGLLQRYFTDWSGKPLIGILVSALFFTVLHFSVTQFIPILFMGVMFGYLYHWTRSLWVPILLHFVNNSLTVAFHHLAKVYPDQPMFRDDFHAQLPSFLLAAAMVIAAMWAVYRIRKTENTEPVWP